MRTMMTNEHLRRPAACQIRSEGNVCLECGCPSIMESCFDCWEETDEAKIPEVVVDDMTTYKTERR